MKTTKKYVLFGFLTGLLTILFMWLWKRVLREGDEFEELYDSSTEPRKLFGDAFKNTPDKL
jgi:hypothetical protein